MSEKNGQEPINRPFARLRHSLAQVSVTRRSGDTEPNAGEAKPANGGGSSPGRARNDEPSGARETSVPDRAGTAEEPESSLFSREMADVERFSQPAGYVGHARRGGDLFRDGGDVDTLSKLDDLVSGRGAFDMSFTAEHVEGLAQGVDRRLLRKLKRGEFSVRAHLDLHGKTRSEARPVVEQFLQRCRERGQRCVLIVHGRGLHSKDHVPVLKESLKSWLTRGRIGRAVLVFCSARPNDGGMGAVYVLLRK